MAHVHCGSIRACNGMSVCNGGVLYVVSEQSIVIALIVVVVLRSSCSSSFGYTQYTAEACCYHA
jgi:hypothetical protein